MSEKRTGQPVSPRKRRGGRGRPFQPGTSGNPGGMPRDLHPLVVEARRLAMTHAPHAIERLAALLDSEDERVQLAAAEALLDRAGVKAIAIDAEPQGAGAGTTLVVQLQLPPRDVPPAFLAPEPAVLPARAATLEAVSTPTKEATT